MAPAQNDPTRGRAGPGSADQFAADRRPSTAPPALPPRTARRRRLAEMVHKLGPAPMLHLLEEVDRGADLDAQLEAYARLPGDFIAAMGGGGFPPDLHPIDGGRR